MKRKTIKFCALVLVVALCAPLLLSGCGKETLWIVTDAQSGTRRYSQITNWVNVFRKSHPEVVIEFEQLPEEESTLETEIERIRTAAMAGRGPDVYLLSTPYTRVAISADTVPLYAEASSNLIFKDVQQAMRSGLFMDISKYYDADEDLEREELVPAVMEAGVYDGKRFVLPLRFDLPICYVDKAQFEEAGISLEVFDQGILALMDAVAASGNSDLAKSCYIAPIIRWGVFNFFPNFLDYENQEVLLTADELSEFINTHQRLRTLAGNRALVDYWSWYTYLSLGYHWSEEFAMQMCGMENIICDIAISKANDIDLAVIPLRAADGTLIADVTYYGAIGNGCAEPELAYEFLRQFLLEDSQWENNEVGTTLSESCMPGWPVRTVNAAEPMFRNQYSRWEKTSERFQLEAYKLKYLKQNVPSDEDLPNWHEEIDMARFSIPMEKVVGEIAWYASVEGYTIRVDPSIATINDFANKVIEDLKWHLAEG